MLAPKLRFKEFNDEWKKIKLKNISTELQYGMNVAATDFDGMNKYIRITDIDDNTHLYNNNPVSPDGKLEEKFLVNTNDILFARTGASTGKTYLYSIEDGRLFFAGFLIRAHIKENNNSRFIFEQTNLSRYKNWLKLTSMRSGQPGINSAEYGNYEFSITNIDEENKIAHFFELLNKKIELQQRKIEVLKMYKRGLINKIFNIQYNNTSRLKDLIKEKSIRNKENIVKEVYSVNNKCGFILQAEQFKDREVASEDTSNYKIVQYNDFAYNPARINVGSIARMKKYNKGIISPMYICFSCKERLLPEYLEYYYDSEVFRHEMTKRLEGSVRMCLSYEAMINIPLDLPKFEEQKRMTKVLVEIDNKIEKEETIYSAINRLKKGLLQKMFI